MMLGAHEQLVAIATLPAAPAPTPATRPVVIALNAGVLHRIGPHRLHVRLARRLAALGFASLRLDLSGIGDSLGGAEARSFRDSAVLDTKAALDGLGATLGAGRFVLFGLCSGADNALATALVDDRVVGIVLVDPHTYITPRARARKLARRVRELGPVGALRRSATLARRYAGARLASLRRAAPAGDPQASEGRETPPMNEFRTQLGALVDRDVRIFAIYSGALGERYNHVDQLFEYAPELRDRLSHAYFPDANHTFTERAAQAELLDAITVWIDRTFR